MRQVKAGSIQDAVRSAYTAAGGLESSANDLGLSPALLSRAVDANDEQRPGGLGVNYLHRLSRIVPEAAAPIAEHFARLAGGEYRARQDQTPSGCIHALMSEFSDIMKCHAEAFSEASPNPNGFTPAEAKAALKEVAEHREKLDAYQRYLEAALTEGAA